MAHRPGLRPFFYGLATGAVLVSALVSGLVAFQLQRGVTVGVEVEQLARMVRAEVAAQARAEIPRLIAELRQGVPAEVERQVAARLSTYTFRVFEVTISLPPEAQAELNRRVTGVVLGAVNQVFDSFDAEQAAEILAERAYALMLAEAGPRLVQRVVVSPWPWLRIPVTLQFQSQLVR